MKKPGLIAGIIIMFIGLLLLNISSIDAIIDSSDQLYMEVKSYDIDLEKKTETIAFNNKDKKRISFWLALPDRNIEDKNLQIVITVLDASRAMVKGFRRDFAFKTIRQEIDKHFYYKLADYKFGNGFEGYIQYQLEGDWFPENKAVLSFKEKRKTSFSMNQVVLALFGGIMLVLGFALLIRNTSGQGN